VGINAGGVTLIRFSAAMEAEEDTYHESRPMRRSQLGSPWASAVKASGTTGVAATSIEVAAATVAVSATASSWSSGPSASAEAATSTVPKAGRVSDHAPFSYVCVCVCVCGACEYDRETRMT
jgi:hypothetical protein